MFGIEGTYAIRTRILWKSAMKNSKFISEIVWWPSSGPFRIRNCSASDASFTVHPTGMAQGSRQFRGWLVFGCHHGREQQFGVGSRRITAVACTSMMRSCRTSNSVNKIVCEQVIKQNARMQAHLLRGKPYSRAIMSVKKGKASVKIANVVISPGTKKTGRVLAVDAMG